MNVYSPVYRDLQMGFKNYLLLSVNFGEYLYLK